MGKGKRGDDAESAAVPDAVAPALIPTNVEVRILADGTVIIPDLPQELLGLLDIGVVAPGVACGLPTAEVVEQTSVVAPDFQPMPQDEVKRIRAVAAEHNPNWDVTTSVTDEVPGWGDIRKLADTALASQARVTELTEERDQLLDAAISFDAAAGAAEAAGKLAGAQAQARIHALMEGLQEAVSEAHWYGLERDHPAGTVPFPDPKIGGETPCPATGCVTGRALLANEKPAPWSCNTCGQTFETKPGPPHPFCEFLLRPAADKPAAGDK